MAEGTDGLWERLRRSAGGAGRRAWTGATDAVWRPSGPLRVVGREVLDGLGALADLAAAWQDEVLPLPPRVRRPAGSRPAASRGVARIARAQAARGSEKTSATRQAGAARAEARELGQQCAELRGKLARAEQRLATAEAHVERSRRLEEQFSWEIVE